MLRQILIAICFVQVISENCPDTTELESNCGHYCFKVVKPLMDVLKSMQNQIDTSKAEEKAECPQSIPVFIKPNIGSPFQKIGSKYYFIEQNYKLNWFDAMHKCLSLGAHLASIKDLVELNAIVAANLQTTQNYWIDLNDLGTEGVFMSIATGLQGTYYNWHSGNPSNSNNNEDCVELHFYQNHFIMNDNDCIKKQLFICEHDNK